MPTSTLPKCNSVSESRKRLHKGSDSESDSDGSTSSSSSDKRPAKKQPKRTKAQAERASLLSILRRTLDKTEDLDIDNGDEDVIGGMLDVIDGRRVVLTSMPNVIDTALDDAADDAARVAQSLALVLEELHLDYDLEEDGIGRLSDVSQSML